MKTVVICGSRRFKTEARAFAARLKKHGVVVYEPYFHSGQDDWTQFSDDYKRFIALGLTYDHFAKIRLADVVFVFNKDGYVGNSTTLEMGYAIALGKPVYALTGDPKELCRHVLFREIISTPTAFIKRLI